MLYAFDEYELDTRLYELRRAGTSLQLEPKVFDLLAYVVEHVTALSPGTNSSNTCGRPSLSVMRPLTTASWQRAAPSETMGIRSG